MGVKPCVIMTCRTTRTRQPNKKKSDKVSEIKFGENGDFFIYPSDLEIDFRVAFDDDMVRGLYMGFIQRAHIYLRYHENIEDIINTCTHETLHHCFQDVFYGTHNCDPIDLDVFQEHWAIRQTAFAEEQFTKDFDYQRNSAIRDMKEN